METKQAKLQLKEIDETGRFVGLSAVYGNRDLGDDVIVMGAFSKTIEENSGKFPLLYGHKVNVGVSIVEDTKEGLSTEGFLNLDNPDSRNVHSNMKFYKTHGLDFGMSIGYMPVPGKVEFKDGARYLRELKLYENTLTEIPMNLRARVSQIKDLSNKEIVDVLIELKAGRRFSNASKAEIAATIQQLRALIADHEPETVSEPGEGAAAKGAEPVTDHSELTTIADRVMALIQQ